MRRAAVTLALVALVLAGLPAAADGPGPGYVATDNVEWLGNIPLNTDSAGARLLDGYLYVTEDRGLTIYDVSDAELPVPVGFTPLPQQAYFTEEDVDTNGEILLIGSFGDLTDRVAPINNLFVIDVRNKQLPRLLSQVQGANAHTISCVLDCTWAYGSNGVVVDLRDPAAPTVAGDWTQAPDVVAAGVRSSHDVSEVAPGLIVTSSNPLLLLDARTDPTNPTVLAKGDPGDRRFLHGNLWPRGGEDRFLLAGGETGGSCDSETDGAFMVWDATAAQPDPVTGAPGTFRMLDEHRVFTGLPTEGNSAYDQYCAHWFSTHPEWHDGGLVAMGWYEHGTRFLRVAAETGDITEVGWFLPLGGSTSAAYWADEEVLYAVDYQRGIDILRFTDEPATRTVRVPGVAPAPDLRPAPLRPRADSVATVRGQYVCPLPR